MNVIDGQAGLVRYYSPIFYSLTINNILNIIILLILAGISISALSGSGLFAKAQQAKNETENAQIEENATLAEYYQWMENYTGGSSVGGGKTITDTANTKPSQAMPANATVLENDYRKGIVIKDSNDNEWVWVEVPKKIYGDSVTGPNDYEGIYNTLNKYASKYRDGKSGQGRYWTDEWYYYVSSSSTLYGYVEKTIADETEYEEAVSAGNLYINRAGIEAISGRYNASNKYYKRNTSLTETQAASTTANSGLSLNDYTTNYKKMLSSVYTNGGFWISRYEAGIKGSDTDTTKARKSHTDITDSSIEAVSQANMIPYNYVYCSEAQALAKKMSTDTSKTSSLLFGIQWDLVCKYLEVNAFNDTTSYLNSYSTSWGNYRDSSLTLNANSRYCTSPSSSSGTWSLYNATSNFVQLTNELYKTNSNTSYYGLLTTGASEQTNKMNIYDFAGNEYEWTLEHATSGTDYPCAIRGGSCNFSGSGYPASYRDDYSTTYSGYGIVGFRSALY